MTWIAGIDYSLTSPAICVGEIKEDNVKFEDCRFHFIRQTKSQKSFVHSPEGLASALVTDLELTLSLNFPIGTVTAVTVTESLGFGQRFSVCLDDCFTKIQDFDKV